MSPNAFATINAVEILLPEILIPPTVNNLAAFVTLSKLGGFYNLRTRNSKILSIVGAPASHKGYKSSYFIAEREGGWGNLHSPNAPVFIRSFQELEPSEEFQFVVDGKHRFVFDVTTARSPDLVVSTYHHIDKYKSGQMPAERREKKKESKPAGAEEMGEESGAEKSPSPPLLIETGEVRGTPSMSRPHAQQKRTPRTLAIVPREESGEARPPQKKLKRDPRFSGSVQAEGQSSGSSSADALRRPLDWMEGAKARVRAHGVDFYQPLPSRPRGVSGSAGGAIADRAESFQALTAYSLASTEAWLQASNDLLTENDRARRSRERFRVRAEASEEIAAKALAQVAELREELEMKAAESESRERRMLEVFAEESDALKLKMVGLVSEGTKKDEALQQWADCSAAKDEEIEALKREVSRMEGERVREQARLKASLKTFLREGFEVLRSELRRKNLLAPAVIDSLSYAPAAKAYRAEGDLKKKQQQAGTSRGEEQEL